MRTGDSQRVIDEQSTVLIERMQKGIYMTPGEDDDKDTPQEGDFNKMILYVLGVVLFFAVLSIAMRFGE